MNIMNCEYIPHVNNSLMTRIPKNTSINTNPFPFYPLSLSNKPRLQNINTNSHAMTSNQNKNVRSTAPQSRSSYYRSSFRPADYYTSKSTSDCLLYTPAARAARGITHQHTAQRQLQCLLPTPEEMAVPTTRSRCTLVGFTREERDLSETV